MGKKDEQLHSEEACEKFSLNTTQCRGAMNQKLEEETEVQLCLLPDFQCGLCSSLNSSIISFLSKENSLALHQGVGWRED